MSCRAAAVLSLAILLTGCGGSAEPPPEASQDASPGSPAAESTTVAADPEMPCGAMTLPAAAGILGVQEAEVTFSYSEELRTCSFRVDLTRSIDYSLYVESDAATAAAEMATVADGLGFIAECEAVDDPGEEALYCLGDNAERLLVRIGRAWVDVRRPAGREVMQRVARQVLQ